MKIARLKLFLLALMTTLVLAIAPSSASAIGPGDVLPKPTVAGLPAATKLPLATVNLSSTVSSSWFVDFGCAFDSPVLLPCNFSAYPTCTAPVGGQHTCSQSVTHPLTPGTHTFRFAAAYCDDVSIQQCETNDNFYASDVEVVTFVVDRIPPLVTIIGGPDNSKLQVLKPGAGSFTFSANEAASFLCEIDTAEPVPCASPWKVPKSLKNGSHKLTVYATDAANNQTSAVRSFRVDVFHPKKCAKGSSKRAKAKRKRCVAKNIADKKVWKKKHGLK